MNAELKQLKESMEGRLREATANARPFVFGAMSRPELRPEEERPAAQSRWALHCVHSIDALMLHSLHD